jgi:hypothetical protein
MFTPAPVPVDAVESPGLIPMFVAVPAAVVVISGA